MKIYDTPTSFNFPHSIEEESFDDAVQDLIERTEDSMDALTRNFYDLDKAFYDFITDSIYDSVKEGAGYDHHYFCELAREEMVPYIEQYFYNNKKVELKMKLEDFPVLSKILSDTDIDTTHKLINQVVYGKILIVKYERFEFQ